MTTNRRRSFKEWVRGIDHGVALWFTDRDEWRKERDERALAKMDIDNVAEWLLGRIDAVNPKTAVKIKATLREYFDATKRKWKRFYDNGDVVYYDNGKSYPEHEQAQSGDEPEGGG